MSRKEIIEIVGAVAIIGAGIYSIAQLENRVSQLEKQSEHLAMGPRGQSCQLIVQRLVERPADKALHDLADKWGCSAMPASDVLPQEENEAPPPPPPPPQPETK